VKITINTFEFISAIKILEKINVNSKHLFMNSVRVEVNNDKIKLTRTDLEKVINVFISADIESSGIVIIPIKTINMLKNLKDDYFELTEDMIITEKKKISYKGYEVEQYPELDTQTDKFFFEITEQGLNKMLEVKYCLGTEEYRPFLKGICFDKNKTIASDWHRLSLRQGSYTSNINKIIIDPQTISLLDKVLDKKSNSIIKVSGKSFNNEDKQLIKFKFNRNDFIFEIIGENLQGEYFNYENFIPKNFETEIEINSNEVFSEIEFMYKISNKENPDKVKLITDKNKLFLDGKITGSIYDKKASREATNKAQYEADLKYYPAKKKIKEIKIYVQQETNRIFSEIKADIQGEKWEAMFNMKYIYEALKQYNSTDLKLKAINDINPLIITTDGENIEMVFPIRKE
jgi:DNA polymerase III sliding clamp (beta) subunit (PCNA family)